MCFGSDAYRTRKLYPDAGGGGGGGGGAYVSKWGVHLSGALINFCVAPYSS